MYSILTPESLFWESFSSRVRFYCSSLLALFHFISLLFFILFSLLCTHKHITATIRSDFDCAWYSHGNNCEMYGSDPQTSNFNKVANEACCICGGGMSEMTPSAAPSRVKSTNPTMYCEDSPIGWYVIFMIYYPCLLYLRESKSLIIHITCSFKGTTHQDLNSIVHGTLMKAIVKNGDLFLQQLTLAGQLIKRAASVEEECRR